MSTLVGKGRSRKFTTIHTIKPGMEIYCGDEPIYCGDAKIVTGKSGYTFKRTSEGADVMRWVDFNRNPMHATDGHVDAFDVKI